MKDHLILIREIAKGDRIAFKSLYEAYAEMVLNTALGFTKNYHNAEEVTQDVFIKVFKNAERFKGDSSVKTWIYRIVVNTSLNYIKKKRFYFQSIEEGEQVADVPTPAIRLENNENAEILDKAIKQLSDNQQTAFVLSYVEGLPRQEVADVMNTSLKAIESLLQRAKSNLREILGKDFDNRRKRKK